MRESDVEHRFCTRCGENGFECLKFGVDGYPDRLVLLPCGKVVWVELKAPGETPRKRQKERHKRLTRAGHAVYTVDTKEGAEELARALKKHAATEEKRNET